MVRVDYAYMKFNAAYTIQNIDRDIANTLVVRCSPPI